MRACRTAKSRPCCTPKTRPVLHVKSLNVDADGVPVQYGITWFNGDLIQLVMEAEEGLMRYAVYLCATAGQPLRQLGSAWRKARCLAEPAGGSAFGLVCCRC